MKEKFYKLEKNNWISIAFKNIRAGDIIVKLSFPEFYYECVEPIHFDEELNCDCITVDSIDNIDNKFQVIKNE
jgi:hypothetical protein